ncbi:glycosyltransferase [Vibrio sp. Of7-15]|uniref:glycosyltransferase n=1 Tax=Vibrio sp. Of7-15 TaxID=2724879 RepID=UPI001EF2FE37|nr:glycosyltransferase [Vibrio sp. Of7-15]MCG7496241.1 glycosyltransferase [Vibrio sp. Of7-15]
MNKRNTWVTDNEAMYKRLVNLENGHEVVLLNSDFSFFQKVWSLIKSHTAIFYCPSSTTYILIALIKAILNRKMRIIYFDLVLARPNSLKQRTLLPIKSWALKKISVLITIHKDLSGYDYVYGIKDVPRLYSPFKANNYGMESSNKSNNMIISCGASQRDYNTLVEAVRGLDVKLVILLSYARQIEHNAELNEFNLPDNVIVIREELSREEYYGYLSQAWVVAIPIKYDAIQPAGISVYLEAMYFKKPCIITKGASTNGLLTNDMAMMVSPGNFHEIKECIIKLKDEHTYNHYSERGFSYADSLEGNNRMFRSAAIAINDYLMNEDRGEVGHSIHDITER